VSEPTPEELAAIIIGRLGRLIGKTLNRDGAGAGIALSKQEEQIAKDINAAVAAKDARIAELEAKLAEAAKDTERLDLLGELCLLGGGAGITMVVGKVEAHWNRQCSLRTFIDDVSSIRDAAREGSGE
jgi:hypothetical protein